MTNEVDETEIDELIETYPFLSAVRYGETWFIGIIQNVENQFVWLYDLQKIKSADDRLHFLHFGQEWSLESNMEVPIEMFIGDRFSIFQHSLRGFARKQIEEIRGHQVNLSETFERRIKKKKIEITIIEQ